MLDAPTTERVIDELFPVHAPRRVRTIDVQADAIPPFTEEFFTAAKSLKKGRAPGPNGILTAGIRIALRCPAVLLQMYNAYVITRVQASEYFPLYAMEKGTIVLIDKKKAVPLYWRPL